MAQPQFAALLPSVLTSVTLQKNNYDISDPSKSRGIDLWGTFAIWKLDWYTRSTFLECIYWPSRLSWQLNIKHSQQLVILEQFNVGQPYDVLIVAMVKCHKYFSATFIDQYENQKLWIKLSIHHRN